MVACVNNFKISLTIDLECDDSPESEDELERLCDYIGERLLDNAKSSAIAQSLAEALIEFTNCNPNSSEDTIH